MTRIAWTQPAIGDLRGIRAYIARDSEAYADSLLLEIFEAVDRLARFPRMGRVVPEWGDEETREIIVGSYRVVYDTGADVVRILTVLHCARQFPTP